MYTLILSCSQGSILRIQSLNFKILWNFKFDYHVDLLKNRAQVSGSFGEAFLVQVGLHKGSVLSRLTFVIVLELFFREVRSGCSEELLYADDLLLVSETIESLKGKLQA